MIKNESRKLIIIGLLISALSLFLGFIRIPLHSQILLLTDYFSSNHIFIILILYIFLVVLILLPFLIFFSIRYFNIIFKFNNISSSFVRIYAENKNLTEKINKLELESKFKKKLDNGLM